MFDMTFTLENFARVATWSIVIGFFGALGVALCGFGRDLVRRK